MQCPACHGPFKDADYEGVPVGQCSRCGGHWLDWTKLGAIVVMRQVEFSQGQREKALAARGQDRPAGIALACPACGKPLERFQYAVSSGVTLDRCPGKCGIWLDPGELERVQVVMEEQIDRFSQPKREKEKAEVKSAGTCPRCKGTLVQSTHDGVEVARCDRCKGYWMRAKDLGEAIAAKGRAAEPAAQGVLAHESAARPTRSEAELLRELRCPTCNQLMERLNYQGSSGIILDRCRVGHGIWLDDGELERVQTFCEAWEARADETAAKYKGLLAKVAESSREREEADAASRFQGSPLARFLVRVFGGES